MNEQEFKQRTKAFALKIIRLVDSLPKRQAMDVIGRQLVKAGTSVGANYRSACRAKSKRDMLAKLAIVEEEADESVYWMELLLDSGSKPADTLSDLMDEANEILSMVVASIKTLRDSL